MQKHVDDSRLKPRNINTHDCWNMGNGREVRNLHRLSRLLRPAARVAACLSPRPAGRVAACLSPRPTVRVTACLSPGPAARDAIALLVLAAMPFTSHAEEAAATAPAALGWSGTGELGLALARGNARSENLNARLAFGKETAVWKHDWYAAALRSKGEVSGDVDGDGIEDERFAPTANRYELGLSSAYKMDQRNYVLGTGRYENDDFSPYLYQGVVSVGYGHVFVRSDTTVLTTEIGPGWRRGRVAGTREMESGVIARGKLVFSHKLTANTELYETLLVESGSDNTFVQNDLGVAVAMSEAFALKAGLQARYNSNASRALGIKKTDLLTTVNLVYNFK